MASWNHDGMRLALVQRRGAAPRTSAVAGETTMDEDEFRIFYSRTAPPLRAYLVGASGNLALADDLLQESYYRLLRANPRTVDDTHRKNYLFRIATNLLRDHRRRRREETGDLPETDPSPSHGDRVRLRTDLMAALAELRPRDRQLLWLASVEGMSHREIAGVLGLRVASIRPMLFRARQRMATLLRARGFGS